MSQAERDAFLDRALAALQGEAALMAEGSPHITSKTGAFELLRDYFRRAGRGVYLRSELPVHYPGERVFAPDLMAVLDVPDPWLDDKRMAWVVAEEGRGVDFVMEILHRGNPQKDLLDNVLDYARMGIPEYFVYDRRRARVLGFRLPFPNGGRYEPIKARGGRLASRQLGLELAIVGGHLRFSSNGADIPETRDLLERANAMLDELEDRAEEAERQLSEATERLEAEALARRDAERRAEEAAQRAEEATQRADEATRRAEAETALRQDLERQLSELRGRL